MAAMVHMQGPSRNDRHYTVWVARGRKRYGLREFSSRSAEKAYKYARDLQWMSQSRLLVTDRAARTRRRFRRRKAEIAVTFTAVVRGRVIAGEGELIKK